jgi:hypothetical protein
MVKNLLPIKTKWPTGIKKGQRNEPAMLDCLACEVTTTRLQLLAVRMKRRWLLTPPHTDANYQSNSLIFMRKLIIIVLYAKFAVCQ